MGTYGGTGKARFSVTNEGRRLYSMNRPLDLDFRRGIARAFDKKYGRREDLASQGSSVGKVFGLF